MDAELEVILGQFVPIKITGSFWDTAYSGFLRKGFYVWQHIFAKEVCAVGPKYCLPSLANVLWSYVP